MKNLFLLCLLVFSLSSQGQENPNIVKINIGSLLVKNFSFQYERAVSTKTSAALGIRFQPYGDIPFQSWFEDQIDEPDIQIGQGKTGNFALTPEFRYYFKRGLHGLYIAPYARYASYKIEAPVRYASLLTTKTAFFKGDIYSFSGGVLFGSQFKLTNNLVLDWYIIGAHIGGSSGELNFTANLTPAEQQNIRNTLDKADIPFIDIEHDINANGGRITSKGAWAGFRGFTVNLGWRF